MGHVMTTWRWWLQGLGVSSWVYHVGHSSVEMHSFVTISVFSRSLLTETSQSMN